MRRTPSLTAALVVLTLLTACTREVAEPTAAPPTTNPPVTVAQSATLTAWDAEGHMPRLDYATADLTLRPPEGEESHTLPVYLALDPEHRERGLMRKTSLPEGAGMLFLWPTTDQRGGFWMANTLIPLSIAFFTRHGEILTILDMEPCEKNPCPSYAPKHVYWGAIEVPKGDFSEWGVEEGWTVELPEGLTELAR